METRFILSSIRREAERLGARGEILSAVRLSGSVNGDRGEGYLLLYADTFVLLCRKLGERDYTGIIDTPGAWRAGAVQEAQYQIELELLYGDAAYHCVFSPSERADAEAILNALREAADAGTGRCSEPMLIFAALLVSLSNADHSEGLRRILDAGTIAAGRRFAAQTTLPELVEQAAKRFECFIRRIRAHYRKQFSLVRAIQRVEAKDVAGCGDAFGNRDVHGVPSCIVTTLESASRLLARIGEDGHRVGVDALRAGCEIKAAIRNFRRAEGESDYELFTCLGSSYYSTGSGHLAINSQPLVLVRPNVPLRYTSGNWTPGNMLLHNTGRVEFWSYDPYTMEYAKSAESCAIRYFAR